MMPVDSNETTCRLFMLPAELRLKIYEEYYWTVAREHNPSGHYLQRGCASHLTEPLSVCRQFLAEMKPVLVKLIGKYLDNFAEAAEQSDAELKEVSVLPPRSDAMSSDEQFWILHLYTQRRSNVKAGREAIRKEHLRIARFQDRLVGRQG